MFRKSYPNSGPASTPVNVEVMKVIPDDPNRVCFDFTPVEEISKQQLDPRTTNMTSVVKTGVTIDPSGCSKVFNPHDPADFDEQAEQLFASAENEAENIVESEVPNE